MFLVLIFTTVLYVLTAALLLSYLFLAMNSAVVDGYELLVT